MPRTSSKYTLVRTLCAALVCAAAHAIGAPTATLASSGGSSVPSAGASSTPAAALAPTGMATWFGPGLYGRETACGQTLTRQIVGLANRTLPCGTLVQVSYAGRTLVAPVVDRGPYSHIASWDLTAGAAQALGITETVRIATQVVGKAADTPTLGIPATAAPSATASGGALAG